MLGFRLFAQHFANVVSFHRHLTPTFQKQKLRLTEPNCNMPKPSDLLSAVTAGEHRLISLQNLKHHVVKSLPVVRILDMVPKLLPHLKTLGSKNNNLYMVFPLFAHWQVMTHSEPPTLLTLLVSCFRVKTSSCPHPSSPLPLPPAHLYFK